MAATTPPPIVRTIGYRMTSCLHVPLLPLVVKRQLYFVLFLYKVLGLLWLLCEVKKRRALLML